MAQIKEPYIWTGRAYLMKHNEHGEWVPDKSQSLYNLMYNNPNKSPSKAGDGVIQVRTDAVSLQQAESHARFQIATLLENCRWNNTLGVKRVYIETEMCVSVADYTREVEPKPTCQTCGALLTDGGYCPVCEDGEEDLVTL